MLPLHSAPRSFTLGAVVVGVEAADHALARADDCVQPAAHLDRLALERLAGGVERHAR